MSSSLNIPLDLDAVLSVLTVILLAFLSIFSLILESALDWRLFSVKDPIFHITAALKFWMVPDRFLFLRYLIAFLGFFGIFSDDHEYL